MAIWLKATGRNAGLVHPRIRDLDKNTGIQHEVLAGGHTWMNIGVPGVNEPGQLGPL